jgi:hypothetical protein
MFARVDAETKSNRVGRNVAYFASFWMVLRVVVELIMWAVLYVI